MYFGQDGNEQKWIRCAQHIAHNTIRKQYKTDKKTYAHIQQPHAQSQSQSQTCTLYTYSIHIYVYTHNIRFWLIIFKCTIARGCAKSVSNDRMEQAKKGERMKRERYFIISFFFHIFTFRHLFLCVLWLFISRLFVAMVFLFVFILFFFVYHLLSTRLLLNVGVRAFF